MALSQRQNPVEGRRPVGRSQRRHIVNGCFVITGGPPGSCAPDGAAPLSYTGIDEI